jgi:transitional endoplasmic reticulum ATPase
MEKIFAKVMRGEGPCTRPNGIALSKPVAEALEVKLGDPILVKGSKLTVGIIESIENISEQVVYLGRTVRHNAGAHWNENVQVQKLEESIPAKKVTIGPPEPDVNLDVDSDALKSYLIGTYLKVGDMIEIVRRTIFPIFRSNGHARFERLLVLETKPKGIVQVTEETEFSITNQYQLKGTTITYDDIGGCKDAIEKLREMIELPLRNPGLFRHLGVEPPKGVLLYGPPGTGKTLLAKAVANESDAHFIYIGASHLSGGYDAERKLREIFAEAEQEAPSIIFIDEIDAIAPKREDSFNPEDRKIVGALLELMDGIKERGQVIVIAATNRPNAIDPALRRPGRFDREIEIPIPNEDGRLEILQIHTRFMPLEDVDLKKLAESTSGYTGADLRLLCSEAAMCCLRRYIPKLNPNTTIPKEILSQMKVTMEDFRAGLRKITPSCGREIIVELPKVSWNKVGGYWQQKSKLEEVVLKPWEHRDKARTYHVKVPKGILLYGPPGTGKTYLAKAIASHAKVPVIVVSGANLKSKWFGEFEKNIEKLFSVARKAAPVIIIIDEVESICPKRSGGLGEASKAMDSGVNEFLRQLDGILELHDVLLICTTNRPDLIDPALLRSGRIDLHFQIPPPDFEARVEIFKVHLADVKAPMDEEVTPEKLAELTDGFVGADIESTVNSAVRKWFYEHITGKTGKLSMQHFLRAIEDVKKNLTKRERL